MDSQKINDIILPLPEEKKLVIDLTIFFPNSILKIIKLNQSQLFSDIYFGLKDNIDLRLVKKLKINKLKKEVKDIFKKSKKESVLNELTNIIKHKKEKTFLDPVNLSEPLKIRENTLDIRDLEIIENLKKYPDIYTLPLKPKQKIRKFLKKNKEVIVENKEVIIKRASLGGKIAIISGILFFSLVLFLIGYKNYMQSSIEIVYKELYNLKTIQNPQELSQKASSIKKDFIKLKILFTPVNFIANNYILSNEKVASAANIINGGSELASLAKTASILWGDFETEKKSIEAKMTKDELETFSPLKKMKITDLLKKEDENINSINNNLKSSISYFAQIKTLGNPALDNKFQETLEKMIKIGKYLDFYIKNKNEILTLAGDSSPQRYFVLNQNKDEIRANGGFPGSVVTIELYKGMLFKYDKKDVYYYDWHITPYRETPPEGLNIISPNHGLRDSNYEPIFAESVKKINFFYEKGGGDTLNTVIAINQGIIEDFLNKYGSVNLPLGNNLGSIEINAHNFGLIMSILVENKFAKVTSPKDILFKFSQELEKKLVAKKDYLGYLDIIINNLLAGEIDIASLNKDTQSFINSFSIFDKFLLDKGNWIYPVFTSISGNKSDRYIARDFEVNTVPKGNCEVLNNFSLTSKHEYNEKDQSEIRTLFDELKITDPAERDRLIAIEGAGENRQFVRILVPKGTTLNKTNGNSVFLDQSNPKYDFIKFYLNTPVGAEKKIEFSYSTKPSNCSEKINFYKQPGLSNYSFNK